MYEVFNNGHSYYETFKTGEKQYPFDGCYIHNNYNDAYINFICLRDGENFNEISEKQRCEVTEMGNRKSFGSNRDKVRKRRTNIFPTNGAVRNGCSINR